MLSRIIPLLHVLSDAQDTDEFCRNIMCSQELLDLVQQQFVCWGGDVRCSDAYSVGGAGGLCVKLIMLMVTESLRGCRGALLHAVQVDLDALNALSMPGACQGLALTTAQASSGSYKTSPSFLSRLYCPGSILSAEQNN